jgi:hypothetical protein
MNELVYVYIFVPSALIAAGMGGYGFRGWLMKRNSKSALLEKAEQVISALEDMSKRNSNAQAAADAATLTDLQNRFRAL